jgi:hypothetical protein
MAERHSARQVQDADFLPAFLHVDHIDPIDHIYLLFEDKLHNVRSHLQGLVAQFLRVVVYVVPSITEVGLEVVVADQAALPEQAKALCRLTVVFVDFGEAIFEVVLLVVDGVAKGQFHEVQFGKNLFHGWADEGVEARALRAGIPVLWKPTSLFAWVRVVRSMISGAQPR